MLNYRMKRKLKIIIAWCVLVSMVIGNSYITNNKSFAEDKRESFTQFINSTVWKCNGSIIDSSAPYQFNLNDAVSADYSYTIAPGKMTEGSSVYLPVSPYFNAVSASGSTDKLDVSIVQDYIKVTLKENIVSAITQENIAVSGPAVVPEEETLQGIITVNYSLQEDLLKGNTFYITAPYMINQIIMAAKLDAGVLPEFLSGVSLKSGGTEVTSSVKMARNAEVSILFQFKCDNGAKLIDFDMDLPDEVVINEAYSKSLVFNEKTLCNVTINPGTKIVSFRFTEDAKKLTNINGEFGFDAQLDEAKIGKADFKTITFVYGPNKTKDFTIFFEALKDKPVFQSRNAGEVKVNGDKKDLNGLLR